MELTDGVGMDRICECSGVPSVVNSTFSLLRKGGQVMLVGLPKQPLHVENVLQDISEQHHFVLNRFLNLPEFMNT